MAKILFADLELSPNLGYSWGGKWEVNILDYAKEWQIISIGWKWEGGKTQVVCMGDFPDKDDRRLVLKLYDLFQEADIIICHNGDSFDIKKAKTRFLFHGLPPTKQLITIDTKKIAKKYFSFNSNSLDDLGKHLGLGRKVHHEGFELWLKCMSGNKSAWRRMKKYNAGDVDLLEKIYQKLRPWVSGHPNIALMNNGEGCPNCGNETFRSDGIRYTLKRKYRRLQCTKCFARFQGSLVK